MICDKCDQEAIVTVDVPGVGTAVPLCFTHKMDWNFAYGGMDAWI